MTQSSVLIFGIDRLQSTYRIIAMIGVYEAAVSMPTPFVHLSHQHFPTIASTANSPCIAQGFGLQGQLDRPLALALPACPRHEGPAPDCPKGKEEGVLCMATGGGTRHVH